MFNHLGLGDIGGLVMLTTSGVLAGWVASAVHALFEGILRILTLERTYTESRNHGGMEALLSTLESTHLFAERRDARGNGSAYMTVAGTVIGSAYVAFVEVETKNDLFRVDRRMMRVRVLRPRWLGPLLPDSIANGVDDEVRQDGSICVMRQSGSNIGALEWQTRRELASPSFVVDTVRADAEAVAEHMEHAARTSPGRHARVLMTGPPGIGKTTSTRLLAMRLGAVLVPSFDPTRPGADIQGLLCDIGHDRGHRNGEAHPSLDRGSWAVIVMEDVDGCMGRLRPTSAGLGPDADASSHGVRTEVVDKASWTGMLDMLQYTPRVVLVMTSNKSTTDLEGLDVRAGGALLRKGRVTDRCDFVAIAHKKMEKMD